MDQKNNIIETAVVLNLLATAFLVIGLISFFQTFENDLNKTNTFPSGNVYEDLAQKHSSLNKVWKGETYVYLMSGLFVAGVVVAMTFLKS